MYTWLWVVWCRTSPAVVRFCPSSPKLITCPIYTTFDKFLANCEAMALKLGPKSASGAGYEYCVVDYLWFQDLANDTSGTETSIVSDARTRNEHKRRGTYYDPINKLHIDEYGRLLPAPDRWPSTWNADGKSVGFRPIADKVSLQMSPGL